MGLVNVKIDGADKVAARLQYIGDNGQKATAEALMAGGKIIESAAKAKCPVRTGNLSRSITTDKVSESTVEVGTSVEYAPYVEYGTYKMSAQPYLLPAMSENKSRVEQEIAKAVKALAG